MKKITCLIFAALMMSSSIAFADGCPGGYRYNPDTGQCEQKSVGSVRG